MHHRCTRCHRVRLWWRRFSVHSYRSFEPERNTATLNFSPLSSFILHSTKFITLSFCCSALLSQIWAMPDFSFFIICKSNTPYYDFCLFCIVLISLHILLYRLVSIWFYCPMTPIAKFVFTPFECDFCNLRPLIFFESRILTP